MGVQFRPAVIFVSSLKKADGTLEAGMPRYREAAGAAGRGVDNAHNCAYNSAKKGGGKMPKIRPVSDLRNHFAEITREVQLSDEPVFLTKNGVGSIVVMSMDCYEQSRYESQVYDKLREAELQALGTAERRSHAELMARLHERLRALEDQERA